MLSADAQAGLEPGDTQVRDYFIVSLLFIYRTRKIWTAYEEVHGNKTV